MHAFIPVWRADVSSARRLYGFSDKLSDEDVIKAVEQVRHQRAGTTRMSPWLLALSGYAWASTELARAQWVEDADERVVLRQLISDLQSNPASAVAVFAAAEDGVRQLRLRLLLQGMDASAAAGWATRFRDGSAWQPAALASEAESAAAILALATGRELYDPWQREPMNAEQACEQALALCELHRKDWI